MDEIRYVMWVIYGYTLWIVVEYAWDWWKNRTRPQCQRAQPQATTTQSQSPLPPVVATPIPQSERHATTPAQAA